MVLYASSTALFTLVDELILTNNIQHVYIPSLPTVNLVYTLVTTDVNYSVIFVNYLY